MSIQQALFELSTISYWINHRGAWFIAMLIPVYAITPVHYRICKKVNRPVLYSMTLIGLVVLVSALNWPLESSKGQIVVANIKQVLYHLPSFFVGFMLAPFALQGEKISVLWMSIAPIVVVLIMKYMQWGYWPEFLVLPFVLICCWIIRISGKYMSSFLNFFGRISLESYLFNGIIGTWIIWYLPQLYYSPLNRGCYLSYFIVCVVGTILAYIVHKFCSRLLNINAIKQ